MAKTTFFSKLISGLSSRDGNKRELGVVKPRPPSLKFVFFILDWKQAKIVTDVLENENVRIQIICQGIGTAKSEVLNFLGIGADNKAVITCLEQAIMIPVLIREVRKKLGAKSPGQGIAFTIPLSAINDPLMLVFKQSIFENDNLSSGKPAVNTRNKGGPMAKEYTHDLIISIVNNGYSDEFMDTARSAGATGGTVIHARSVAHEGLIKHFGISVQGEKEIILLLCSRDKKARIIQAVCEVHGLNSEACGIVFSLPVDDVMSLSLVN